MFLLKSKQTPLTSGHFCPSGFHTHREVSLQAMGVAEHPEKLLKSADSFLEKGRLADMADSDCLVFLEDRFVFSQLM